MSEERPTIIELTEDKFMDEPKKKNPINAKVGAGTLGGALAYTTLRLLAAYDIQIEPGDASVLTLLFGTLAAYMKRE